MIFKCGFKRVCINRELHSLYEVTDIHEFNTYSGFSLTLIKQKLKLILCAYDPGPLHLATLPERVAWYG